MKQINIVCFFVLFATATFAQQGRQVVNFNDGWKFKLGDDVSYKNINLKDDQWRALNLPHDWSIEGKFDSTHPARNAGGALPGGIGWYRKTFTASSQKNKKVYIEFDGVHRHSEVWINEKYLGKWPYGYTSFRYELTPHLKNGKNTIAVKVDNSQQPNSRWYTGSGIYRNVRLVTTNTTAIKHWGVFVTTPRVSQASATINVALDVAGAADQNIKIVTRILNASGKQVAEKSSDYMAGNQPFSQVIEINNPKLWSINHPYLYKLVTSVYKQSEMVDEDTTNFGIRYFNFDVDKGFSLNGKPMKILGVCQHHDLGALGAAYNHSAAKRQLRILKEMGVNAIRMAHNPPAPQLLDLCDKMGFLVMNESFDMWAKKKNKFDYFLDFPEWHQKDLEHMVKRDRNHPSVIMWSIGNEIREQFDSTGITLTRKLVNIVKDFDTTRPVTCALSESDPKKNYIYQSGALDIVGLNYRIDAYKDFQKNYPGVKLIASENVSGLMSRGHYDMPADSMRYWPPSSKTKYVENGNADFTVSAYDNVAAYWGTSHENNWKLIKKYDYISGLFVWSGFDFLGEPVPYPYPARSSYYGIIDLAGFPKDVYYMYQSEWTKKPVLHLFPHWNWKPGQVIDVKAYYNNADEVELFLNGKSLGKKTKHDTAFHVLWRVPYEAGELKAVSRSNGKAVLEKKIYTAGKPARIELVAEDKSISIKNKELAFVQIRITDKDGNLVPDAGNLIKIKTNASAHVVAMDNGNPADLNALQDEQHHVYKGLGIVILKGLKPGLASITASSPGLPIASVSFIAK